MREPAFSLLSRPKALSLQGKRVLVLGLGDTGLSVARWVAREGGTARVADTRLDPPRRKEFAGEFHGGPFEASRLEGVDLVCVSPGISLESEIIRTAAARGVPVAGDIELFAWAVRDRTGGGRSRSRVAAVTGTNGKSTVTALTGHLLRAAGVDCEVAGNIAPPALDALRKRERAPAAWVLELSSYQLETTWSLEPDAAALLNISEDHLDRYAGMDEYAAAKARIFMGAGVRVLNREDPRSMACAVAGRRVVTFGLGPALTDKDFGVSPEGILVKGKARILDSKELPVHGAHNAANALAACALAEAMGAPLAALADGLRGFRGLPHRLERVALRRGVAWYDDSKGTNVGATLAALTGLREKAVLILGGEGKGQDFSPLAAAVRTHARTVLLIGRDAARIERALAASGVPIEHCRSLEEAVERAAASARAGDAVLLSPACASFDMFRDYAHRGEAFARAVRGLGDG
jgi:UDP-N-acetylmuramoylalanine--D-glutamate ligase